MKFAVSVVNLQSEYIMRFSESDRAALSEEMLSLAIKIAMFMLLPTVKQRRRRRRRRSRRRRGGGVGEEGEEE